MGKAKMKKTGKKESRLKRYIKAPFRSLSKVRDFYMKTMWNCAGKVSHAGDMGYHMPHVPTTLPKSFSVNSCRSSDNGDDDFRELVRAASIRNLEKKVQVEVLRRQRLVPRSQSVAIGRIDEDKSCEFGFEEDDKVKPDTYTRSRTYA